MKFEESEHSKTLDYYKLEMPFGKFYLCERFLISEINSGVHFDWNKAQTVLKEVIEFYKPGKKLGYISNRINSYSVNPEIWTKTSTTSSIMIASAIVYYNYMMYLNASLEKRFSKVDMHCCLSLQEAINWITNLEGLN